MVNKVFFWEKLAFQPEDEQEDKLGFYEINEDPNIRELIQVLESKIIGNEKEFRDIKPGNTSIKKWITNLLKDYPGHNADNVDDLLNEFRYALHTRSKEKDKFIVGLLQLRSTIVITHSKKDVSLAELKNKLYSVKNVLHSKNIIRADIIKRKDGKTTLSAYEYNKKLSKGHADFWGIEPEDIGWGSLGSITLNVELERFHLPVQIPVEFEDLDRMMINSEISATGRIKVGNERGKITKVFIYRNELDYPKFYDSYVRETEKLDYHKKYFDSIVVEQPQLDAFSNDGAKYRYEEDDTRVYRITINGSETIAKKEHPRYIISYFTKIFPGIRPTAAYLWRLYESVFENKFLEICHVGELMTREPFSIGNLRIHNQIRIPDWTVNLSESMLNQIRDAQSKKGKFLLQYALCELYSKNMENVHLNSLFSFFKEYFVVKELDSEFQDKGLLLKEEIIEFKSADFIKGRPKEFVHGSLVPTVQKYLTDGRIARYCILFGVEDNSVIKPIYNIKSDEIFAIEGLANLQLKKSGVTIGAVPIPFDSGTLLAVFITPNREIFPA